MKKLNLSQARKLLPSLVDEVSENGTTLVITRRGRAVAMLVPAEDRDDGSVFPLRGLPIRVARDFDSVRVPWEAGGQ